MVYNQATSIILEFLKFTLSQSPPYVQKFIIKTDTLSSITLFNYALEMAN